MNPKKPTPLQESAVNFVALLAENVDQQRGILSPHGTPETRSKVAALIKSTFFKDETEGQHMALEIENLPGGFLPPAEPAPYRAAIFLRKLGHTVEEQDIPGLWRINGGAEITSNQLIQIASNAGC